MTFVTGFHVGADTAVPEEVHFGGENRAHEFVWRDFIFFNIKAFLNLRREFESFLVALKKGGGGAEELVELVDLVDLQVHWALSHRRCISAQPP